MKGINSCHVILKFPEFDQCKNINIQKYLVAWGSADSLLSQNLKSTPKRFAKPLDLSDGVIRVLSLACVFAAR